MERGGLSDGSNFALPRPPGLNFITLPGLLPSTADLEDPLGLVQKTGEP